MGLFSTLSSVIRFDRPIISPRKRRLARAANIDDLRLIAKRRLPGGIFDYIDGAAEDEVTARRNVHGFSNIEFRPRVLADVASVDTTTDLFGYSHSLPLMLGPTGFTRMANSQGELAVARAAEHMGLPYTLSTLSTRSIEEVGKETLGVKWFQVYVWRDRGLVAEMVERARTSGYAGLMVTVDTAVLGRRERDVRRGFTLPPKIGLGTIIDGAVHPSWTFDFLRHEPITFANVATRADKNGGTAVTLSSFINEQFDPALSWKDIEWLRGIWNGPLMLKGIQRIEDASIAAQHNVNGIMVSNHGGRQLDYAPASIAILEEVVQEVGGRMTVICDGGIRRGSDIVKAIALGANACSIGRAYLYGLGAAGEVGVTRALAMLRDETQRTMALAGVRSIGEITRDLVNVRTGTTN